MREVFPEIQALDYRKFPLSEVPHHSLVLTPRRETAFVLWNVLLIKFKYEIFEPIS